MARVDVNRSRESGRLLLLQHACGSECHSDIWIDVIVQTFPEEFLEVVFDLDRCEL
jgi:hypothetical protein